MNNSNKDKNKTDEIGKGVQKPVWLKISEKEVEEIVVKLARRGMTPERIGIELRDRYGIPTTKIFGKKITQILRKHNINPLPQDLASLLEKARKLRKHMQQHKKDASAKRGWQIVTSKIRKLTNYYKKRGVLPPEWHPSY